jgi:hypothetical protein
MKNSNDNKTLYGLKIETFGKSPIVEITEDEFVLARDSMRLLIDALEAEEGLNLVLENYIEYETELFSDALRSLVQQPHTWSEFNEKIYDVNRRVVNLLSGCRSYVDQTRHFLSRHFGSDSEELSKFCDLAKFQYEERLGYRAMEELRNTAQHRGIAVHSLSYNHWKNGKESNMVHKNTLSPFIHPAILAEDKKFKKSILNELISKDKKVNLRPLINSYVAGIVNLHLKVREILVPRIDSAEKFIISLIKRYQSKRQGNCNGLIAAKFDKNGIRIDRVPLFDDHITRRKILEKRTNRAPTIEKIFTTNEVREEK